MADFFGGAADAPFDRSSLTLKAGEDFARVKELGLEFLRYGPPYYRTHCAPGKYDWNFADETFSELKRLGITPIVDLCHFGVPDWIGDFQNWAVGASEHYT